MTKRLRDPCEKQQAINNVYNLMILKAVSPLAFIAIVNYYLLEVDQENRQENLEMVRQFYQETRFSSSVSSSFKRIFYNSYAFD